MKYARLISLCLIISMLFAMSACDILAKSPITGEYTIHSMTSEGETLDYEMLKLAEVTDSYLIMKENRTGELYLSGEEKNSIKWDDKTMLITMPDKSNVPFTAADGVVTIALEGGNTISFKKFESDAGEKPAPDKADTKKPSSDKTSGNLIGGLMGSDSQKTPDIDWWQGDWYGWWMIFDGDGSYADLKGASWDCCAYIEESEKDYIISIWDEEYNDYFESCLAEVPLKIDAKKGVATSQDGGFFLFGDVNKDDWSIDCAYPGVENMLIIEGTFTDADGETCEYGIVLTKWGVEWNEDESTTPPAYYESYFLPMIKAGEELPTVFEP